MRRWKETLPALALAGALIGLISCEQEVNSVPEIVLQPEQSSPVETISPVEESAPAEEPNSPPGPVADNSRCHACHLNFRKESLSSTHAAVNVGCEHCHGASDAHRSDEDIVTPPDVMFAKAGIKPFCTGCHPHDAMTIPAHVSVLAEADPLKACCTDCHGEHRLNYRTRKWDKITRALIKDDRVRTLTDEVLERR